jgi:dihydroflavonol-4-reductase
VTGASGFVGRHLLPLLAREFALRVLVRRGQAVPHLEAIPHERVEGSLEELAAIERGITGADFVVHLAALVSFRREDRAALFATNARATAEIARLARERSVRRMLHVSTISAVSYCDRPELSDETAPYNFGPLRIGYSDSKFAAERHVLAEVARGLDAVIVNPPSMYGADDRRKIHGSLLGAVLRGGARFAPPGGLNVANVDDICTGMLAALRRGRLGERYILGGENLTGLQLLQRIAAAAGMRAPSRTLPRSLVLAGARALSLRERCFGTRPPLTSEIVRLAPRFLWFSSAKAERELGWRARSVDAGIEAALREFGGTR